MSSAYNTRRWELRRREALIRCFTNRELGTFIVMNNVRVKEVAAMPVTDLEVAEYAMTLQVFGRVDDVKRHR